MWAVPCCHRSEPYRVVPGSTHTHTCTGGIVISQTDPGRTVRTVTLLSATPPQIKPYPADDAQTGTAHNNKAAPHSTNPTFPSTSIDPRSGSNSPPTRCEMRQPPNDVAQPPWSNDNLKSHRGTMTVPITIHNCQGETAIPSYVTTVIAT